jgi:amino acid permease
MSSNERIREKRGFRQPLIILGIAMTVFYLGLGAMLMLWPTFLPNIPPEFRTIFAVMLLVYGAYRGWRVYADLSN